MARKRTAAQNRATHAKKSKTPTQKHMPKKVPASRFKIVMRNKTGDEPLRGKGGIIHFKTQKEAQKYIDAMKADVKSGKVFDFNKMYKLGIKYKIVKV